MDTIGTWLAWPSQLSVHDVAADAVEVMARKDNRQCADTVPAELQAAMERGDLLAIAVADKGWRTSSADIEKERNNDKASKAPDL